MDTIKLAVVSIIISSSYVLISTTLFLQNSERVGVRPPAARVNEKPMALDPSIKKVEKIDAVENTFVLRRDNQDVIMQDGKIIDTNILSSGTKAGIDIANVVAAVINGYNGFYYCDEKFSYIHSDIEKAFLSVMIECLKSNDQLFLQHIIQTF